MIKIPLEKYKNDKKIDLVSLHYDNIKNYIIDVIQIYINCLDIIIDIKKGKPIKTNISNRYKNGVKHINNTNTYKSIIEIISEEKISTIKKPTIIKNIEDIFIKNKIRIEFFNNCERIKSLFEELLNIHSEMYIEKIIKGEPTILIDNIYKHIYNKYKKITENGQSVFAKESIKKGCKLSDIFVKVFNYDKFIDIDEGGIDTYDEKNTYKKWNAYDFCEKLDVRVCPYCNRNYTFTVRKVSNKNKIENITRPQLDHYFPKSKFPMFALSFFNLVPSCGICNSTIKGDEVLDLNENIHPYLEGLDNNYKFNYEISDYSGWYGNIDKISIVIKPKTKGYSDKKSDNELEFFKIEEIYKQHKDVIGKQLNNRKKYPDSMLKEITKLINSKSNKKITKEELFNDIFYKPNEKEIIDISLGKLRVDIIEELNKIIE